MNPYEPPSRSGRPLRRASAVAAILLAGLAAAASCRLYRLERRLNPKDADFYEKVQYIMTREERKIFLELPETERSGFVDEFWRRRNPNPDAGENAFKAEYESRVARAGELFNGEGRPGYLTDRGRIYILFGPPSERLTYPMDAAGFCREVWYYGAFPVIFVDEHCQGQYLLTAINLEHLQAINIAQGRFQRTFEQDTRFFDYDVKVLKARPGRPAGEGTILIEIPYAGLWFDAREEGLSTALEVEAEVLSPSGNPLWRHRASYALAMSEDELKAKKGQRFRVEIPFALNKENGVPRGGPLRLRVSVKNGADGEELKKVLEFRLEP